MPNIMPMIPGVDRMTTTMMKNLIKKKGVASIEELREAAVDMEVKMIACQMTLDLFEIDKSDLIDEIEIGGAATWMQEASSSDINLYI
jgi:peroxiredoxin family protein